MNTQKADSVIERNAWKPITAKISKIVPQTAAEKLYYLDIEDHAEKEAFKWMPGQFLALTVFGVGEAPFSITSTPTRDTLEVCVRATGSITNSLAKMKEGDVVGLRGPFGNTFVLPETKSKNIVIVAGGIGLIPLRALINYVLDNRDDYGQVFILYGTRDPTQLLFKDGLKTWQERDDIIFNYTVDQGHPDVGFGESHPSWKGNVGVVTTLFSKMDIPSKDTYGFIVGPPVMFKFAVKELEKLKIPPTHIIASLERVMHCGIGKCAHCQIGDILVCRDGPVFTYDQIKAMPDAI